MNKYPKLLKVEIVDNLKLILYYEKDENRLLDLSKYMISEYFKELENFEYFKKVRIFGNTISWPNEQDIAPETIYNDSIPIKDNIFEITT